MARKRRRKKGAKRSLRKPKTARVPRTRAGGEWTEAAYWAFIRGVLRDGAQRYPPIVRQALERQRRPSQRPDKRIKWEYQCQGCGDWFLRKEIDVDHIVPCGKLTDYSHCGDFIMRLYCEPDGLQVLCKDKCHAPKTRGKKVDPQQLWLEAIGASDSDELETPG